MSQDYSLRLEERAKTVWLGALVWYRGGCYSLSRPGYEENVALGDSEQEASETLDTMIRHANLPAIAEEIAGVMVNHAQGRYTLSCLNSTRYAGGAHLKLSRSSPRTLLGIAASDELRDLIFDALPDGWSYNGNGWWSPPDAPQTVAEMRRELEELRG